MAKEGQAVEKPRRSRNQNDALRWKERAAVPQRSDGETVNHQINGNADDELSEVATISLFQPGSRVWLYMKRVKAGLNKKLAHRWHGPCRVKQKVEEYAYVMELSDRSGYRSYLVVHESRLTDVSEFKDRPRTRLAQDSHVFTVMRISYWRIAGNLTDLWAKGR
ncbi:hypothetical protein PC116_g15982 [Phytophthora cactorum]|uniref:Uncharacterized protein n=1 Tax=Phytophthora cactorum TaxID=29920 RepID=A0A329SVH0_9STRA|nr:hypothetical protein Pcac1_g4577 [Phytophthora cactorum]KAG2930537.1 hypothetical protein PC114_g2446 [Phytophthora cactorum]KAG2954461.1 hypothetical protein PC117_g1189 [Phytophthora cactorum]KAG3037922.1 hypothetical protein PC119_g3293 [Phytophthora cactorum]KAG4235895.1 hypothetical protein PC116_g15982 [Phytophthora cactorum]